MEGYGGPAQPSPTIGQCLNGGLGWLEVECNRCKTRASLPLVAIRRPRDTPLWKLEPSLKCRSCLSDAVSGGAVSAFRNLPSRLFVFWACQRGPSQSGSSRRGTNAFCGEFTPMVPRNGPLWSGCQNRSVHRYDRTGMGFEHGSKKTLLTFPRPKDFGTFRLPGPFYAGFG